MRKTKKTKKTKNKDARIVKNKFPPSVGGYQIYTSCRDFTDGNLNVVLNAPNDGFYRRYLEISKNSQSSQMLSLSEAKTIWRVLNLHFGDSNK
jgi:hypothetical protein